MERNLLLLIFFSNILFASDIFWFSYRNVTRNNAIVYEEKNISPITISFKGKKSSTCRVKLNLNNCGSKLNCLNKNFFKILHCFYKSDIKITSQSELSTKDIKAEVELIIVPTRFIVDFKDDFANITILK